MTDKYAQSLLVMAEVIEAYRSIPKEEWIELGRLKKAGLYVERPQGTLPLAQRKHVFDRLDAARNAHLTFMNQNFSDMNEDIIDWIAIHNADLDKMTPEAFIPEAHKHSGRVYDGICTYFLFEASKSAVPMEHQRIEPKQWGLWVQRMVNLIIPTMRRIDLVNEYLTRIGKPTMNSIVDKKILV